MADGGGNAEDESWTDMEDLQPDLVEVVPVRHGMVLAGRYAIEKIIGRGGSGVVVRAHDRDLNEEVAIKIVRAELAGQRMWAARLAREVRLARQIQHPHVCRVFDFQQADGRVFLVMELAEGGTLRDEIRSGAAAARPLADRIADARAVASALDAIHAAGIVHRDLTAQNLLRMGDGRLVLSDFGLATDAGESTSVHGGTVAYMAPEVMRGGQSSVASDVWALGVVMHEIVFGVKPRWSDAGAGEMLPPDLGRKLTEEERVALEACRACAAKEPARRIASAAEAGRLLTERRGWWWWKRRLGGSKRAVILAGALTVVAAVVVGLLRSRPGPPATRAPTPESPLIVPTGEAADWTDVSTVLAEVPERIQCTRLLPDQRTIRFVWGTPPRAEDIDTVTRKRVRSPLVPAAYAEGCPDLSPDGKRLVYQGHAPDGRAVAFVSERPDGTDAVAVVPTAEPTVSSEPTWLGTNQAFAYDVDTRHVGVFAVGARRMYVLPETTSRPFMTLFWFVNGSRVFVATGFESLETEFVGISSPTLTEEVRFRVPEPALDLRSDGSSFYYAGRGTVRGAHLVEVDVEQLSARRVGGIPGQIVRYPMFTVAGLAFASLRRDAKLFVGHPDGSLRQLTNDLRVNFARRCGEDFIVSATEGNRGIVKRVDGQGRLIRILAPGPEDFGGACSADGRTWFFSHIEQSAAIRRCDDSGCRDIAAGAGGFPAVSPDGTRIVFLLFEKRGPIVKWTSVDGGVVHEVSETETGCAAGWASAQTLWVSRRRAGKVVWIEVNADSGEETGKSVPGSRDCADGREDPASPVESDLRIVYDLTSQLRLLAREDLTRK